MLKTLKMFFNGQSVQQKKAKKKIKAMHYSFIMIIIKVIRMFDFCKEANLAPNYLLIIISGEFVFALKNHRFTQSLNAIFLEDVINVNNLHVARICD